MPYTSLPFAARATAFQGMMLPAFARAMAGARMITTITTAAT